MTVRLGNSREDFNIKFSITFSGYTGFCVSIVLNNHLFVLIKRQEQPRVQTSQNPDAIACGQLDDNCPCPRVEMLASQRAAYSQPPYRLIPRTISVWIRLCRAASCAEEA